MSWCSFGGSSKAGKRYTSRMLTVMCSYVVVVLMVTRFVRTHHPAGAEVYFLAALPTIPVLCMLGVVGRYLHEEQDEFQRMLVVRSLLWAIAVSLGLAAFTDFLRSYGAIVALPPFTEFVAFWVAFGIVQGIQSTLNRADE